GCDTTFNSTDTNTAGDIYGSAIPAGLDPSTPVLGTVAFTAPQNAGGGCPQNTYNFIVRADYNPGGKTQMFGRVVDYKEIDQPGSVFSSPYSQYDVAQTIDNKAYLF